MDLFCLYLILNRKLCHARWHAIFKRKWSTKVQTTREDFNHCQEAVISAQPVSNKGESRKWRKSGAFPGEDGMDQQKKRQKVQKYLSELRNIIPSGGSVRFIE